MVSFDFKFQNASSGDFLSFGIGDKLLFAMEANYIEPNTTINSGLIDISAYAGQNVELFFGLNSDGISGASMTISKVKYHKSSTCSAPSAPMSVSASDGTYPDKVRVSWSVSSGAEGYEIWRNTSNNSGSAFKIGDSGSSPYDDTSVVAGTAYWYWVKAKNSCGTSGFSSADHGYASTNPKNYSVSITKCTVTAGSKLNTDKISFSGAMNAAADDFNDANGIEVTVDSNDIVSPCVLTFPINNNTFKKGKYSYSGTGGIVKKSFTYDVKTHKFAFSASNLDLSGLDCPVTAKIDINDFNALALLDEAIVNGPKMPIPIQLMTGVKNVLRVDKCTVKQGKKPNTDQLTVSGAFTVEDLNVSMAGRISAGLVITLDTQTFTIPAGSLKPGKGNFSCTKAVVTEDNSIAAAAFDFNKCSFTLTIKNTNIPTGLGEVGFGVSFTGFDEIVVVTLP